MTNLMIITQSVMKTHSFEFVYNFSFFNATDLTKMIYMMLRRLTVESRCHQTTQSRITNKESWYL